MTAERTTRGTRNGAVLKPILAVVALVAVAAVAFLVWSYQNPLALTKRLTRSQLDKSGLEKTSVEAGGQRLVLWRGGAGPDLVFLHGSGHHAGGWAPVVEGFLADHRVHVLDLPGHGESEPASGPLPMASIYGGMAAYLDTLESPPVLVGNSMGAWLATLYAHRSPDRVSRIVLVNGGALFNEQPEGISLTPADREEARRTMAALRDPSNQAVPDFVLDDIVEQAGKGPIGRMLQDMPGLVEHLLDGRLGEVAVPVDLLWGASDGLMTVEYAERMAAEFPRARLTPIERCGHIPMNECPERFAESLRLVLDREPPESARVAEPTEAPAEAEN